MRLFWSLLIAVCLCVWASAVSAVQVRTGAADAEEARPMDGGESVSGKMSAEQLRRKLLSRRKRTLGFHLVDLRNEAEYRESYIPGAVNVPLRKLSFVGEKIFGKSDEIVFYGRSGKDPSAANAVTFMKNKGYELCLELEEGIRGWGGELEKSGEITE